MPAILTSMNASGILLGWALLSAAGDGARELSGVVRIADELWAVGDGAPGQLYVLPLEEDARRFPFDKDSFRSVTWPAAACALDPESVEVLADGRVVILSERLGALVGEEGVLACYEPSLGTFGGRGLEGLAVRPTEHGSSRIAVLFEGGRPDPDEVPPELRTAAQMAPLAPRVLVHELKAGDHGVDDPLRITLRLPDPGGPLLRAVRAPELVWSVDGSGGEGFVVLLQEVDHRESPALRTSWLQRFGLDGRPVGEPLALAGLVPEDLSHANWEGMDWFLEERELVLVHDKPPKGKPAALVVTLPTGW